MENPFELILEKLNTIETLLKHQAKQDRAVDIAPINDILSITLAAEYLSLSKSSLYKMTSGRLIPFYKVSKKVYFKRKELDEWIDKHKMKTQEEIEQEAIGYLLKPRKYRSR